MDGRREKGGGERGNIKTRVGETAVNRREQTPRGKENTGHGRGQRDEVRGVKKKIQTNRKQMGCRLKNQRCGGGWWRGETGVTY